MSNQDLRSNIDCISTIDLGMILTWGSIQCTPHGIIIYVPKLKMIQFSQCIQSIPLAASPNKMFCPVEALSRLASLYGLDTCAAKSPVFRLPTNNGSWTPMTKGDFIPFFRSRIKQMGLEPTQYALHGFLPWRHTRMSPGRRRLGPLPGDL